MKPLSTHRLAACAIVASAWLFLTCNAVARAGGATVPVADTVATDPAKSIEVSAGQLFLIALPHSPGTGYSWRVSAAPNPSLVTMTGSSFLAGKTGLMGAPGLEIFVYAAHAAGATTISLDDVAPGRDATVAKTLHFKVVIKKS